MTISRTPSNADVFGMQQAAATHMGSCPPASDDTPSAPLLAKPLPAAPLPAAPLPAAPLPAAPFPAFKLRNRLELFSSAKVDRASLGRQKTRQSYASRT